MNYLVIYYFTIIYFYVSFFAPLPMTSFLVILTDVRIHLDFLSNENGQRNIFVISHWSLVVSKNTNDK